MTSNNFTGKANPLALSNSERLWRTARDWVPGGAQTFSKQPGQFVNGVAPKFLERGSGSKVWDIDGNQYIDYVLGLGAVVLGHAHPEVNAAITEVLGSGNLSSLIHPLEIEVAQLLVQNIPCAEMIKFAKNGSDVTAGAVRLARAVTGRDKIACCGYHGWHDWYIGSTSRSLGVPETIRKLTLSFRYNDPASLESLFSAHQAEIAAVIMEPITFSPPENCFLEFVADITRRNGALLIFDEVIMGCRAAIGGAQELLGITPDLATFGKAMANGLPFSCLVGKADLMRRFEDVFFSFTFAGDLAALAAVKATLAIIKRDGALRKISDTGALLQKGYEKLALASGLASHTRMIGYPFWPEFLFINSQGGDDPVLRSLFQQEIVRRGILTRAGMMLSAAHDDSDVKRTLDVFQEAFDVLKQALIAGNVRNWLDGDIIQPVIRDM